MKDQFEKWDRFYRNYQRTRDPHKALVWTEYEIWVEKRRLKHFASYALRLATESHLRACGKASKPTTKG